MTYVFKLQNDKKNIFQLIPYQTIDQNKASILDLPKDIPQLECGPPNHQLRDSQGLWSGLLGQKVPFTQAIPYESALNPYSAQSLLR